jgi:FixJ family two-component response regulator
LSTSLKAMIGKRATIAIVEDDAGVRTALVQLLRSAGFTARSFATAEEFLEALRGEGIDCLIADVNLPGMSGVALVQTLTSGGKGPPAVIMTGRDDPYTVELVKQVAPVRCLRKPFSDDDLFDAIRLALAA